MQNRFGMLVQVSGCDRLVNDKNIENVARDWVNQGANEADTDICG
jgi:hypothetical protein